MINKKYFDEVVLVNGKIKAISMNLKSIDDLGNILEYIKDDLTSAKKIIIIFSTFDSISLENEMIKRFFNYCCPESSIFISLTDENDNKGIYIDLIISKIDLE